MKLDFEISAAEADFPDTDGGEFISPGGSSADKLRDGIEAARAGERERARVLLLEAAQVEPNNEEVWMWLASVSEYPEELLGFLERALALNPNNERAFQWSRETKSLLSKTFVERGAESENQNAFARQCFERAILHDDENETAWLHLAETADTDAEKRTHLKKVLSLNPENAVAADALAEIYAADTFVEETNSVMNEDLNGVNLQTDVENLPFDAAADYHSSPVPQYELPCYYEAEDDALPLDRPAGGASSDYFAEQQQMQTGAKSEISAENPSPTEIEIDGASGRNATLFDFSGCVEKSSESEFQTAAQQQPKTLACPFCSRENEPQTFLCAACRAMLSLSDLEMLLGYDGANCEIVRQAVERAEMEMETRDLSADELKFLGVGQINLKLFREGLASLRQAVQANPNDVVLGAQVNALAIRLAEIEQQASIHSSMPHNKTILIVDDSATVRRLISGKLEKNGHAVICAVDGVDALEKIETIVPDLILLDIAMPRMDGYQVCKMIRTNEKTRDVPVVMISGKDGFFDKVRGRMAGTTGYITKPFGPETLMKTVENYIV